MKRRDLPHSISIELFIVMMILLVITILGILSDYKNSIKVSKDKNNTNLIKGEKLK